MLLKRKARLRRLSPREKEIFNALELAYQSEDGSQPEGVGAKMVVARIRQRLMEDFPDSWQETEEWQECLRLSEEIKRYAHELRSQRILNPPGMNDDSPSLSIRLSYAADKSAVTEL